MITNAVGISLAVTLTRGNRNDVTQLIPCSKRRRPGTEHGSGLGTQLWVAESCGPFGRSGGARCHDRARGPTNSS